MKRRKPGIGKRNKIIIDENWPNCISNCDRDSFEIISAEIIKFKEAIIVA